MLRLRQLALAATQRDPVKRRRIVRDRSNARCDDIPRSTRLAEQPHTYGPADIVLGVMPGHFIRRQYRKHRLRRQNGLKPESHVAAQRRADAIGLFPIRLQPPVMEEDSEFVGP